MTSQSTDQEIAQLAALLGKLEPGLLPFDVFHQIARLMALPIVELVPLRMTSAGRVEVLLLQREADDPVWAGRLHVPGTVVRASDTPGSFGDALARLLEGELHGMSLSQPVFVQSLLHRQARGMEAAQVYWAEVRAAPTVGGFYEADNLPDTLVQTQMDFIPAAVAHFKQTKS